MDAGTEVSVGAPGSRDKPVHFHVEDYVHSKLMSGLPELELLQEGDDAK